MSPEARSLIIWLSLLTIFLGVIYTTAALLHNNYLDNIFKPAVSFMGDFTEISSYEANKVTKYRYQTGHNQYSSFQQVLHSFENGDEHTIRSLIKVLTTKYDAVFWECAPVTQSDYNTKPFEFIVMSAPTLALRVVDMDPFQNKFSHRSEGEDVISFQNLGLDSTLVVPAPPQLLNANNVSTIQHFTHLSSFLKHGEHTQIVHLFNKLGSVVRQTITSESPESMRKFWISTSGLGVSWLHIRIDTVPKYYNWKEYKAALK